MGLKPLATNCLTVARPDGYLQVFCPLFEVFGPLSSLCPLSILVGIGTLDHLGQLYLGNYHDY